MQNITGMLPAIIKRKVFTSMENVYFRIPGSMMTKTKLTNVFPELSIKSNEVYETHVEVLGHT